MPCSGPSMPDDSEIDAVTDEVLEYLRQKHRVHDMPKEFHHGFTAKNRAEDRAKLRIAIKALLDGRNCEEW